MKTLKLRNVKSSIVNRQWSIELGFTLIEIIVVIGIISILSAMIIALIDPFSQFQKARDAERKSDLSQVQKELEQYYQDTGHYPAVTGYEIEGLSGTAISWGRSDVNNWPYANQLPQDPDKSRTYVYYTSDKQSYWLYASLERGGKDTQACNNGKTCTSITSNAIPTTACGTSVLCNYGVSSPNTTP